MCAVATDVVYCYGCVCSHSTSQPAVIGNGTMQFSQLDAVAGATLVFEVELM
jgi:hypothetical protein